MKRIFICIFIILIQYESKAQVITEYVDSVAMIKCHVVNFKSYMLLNIENIGCKPIYIPDLFRIDNDCERMDCYLGNHLGHYPFVQQEVEVIKIEPKHDWGFIYKVLDEFDFGISELDIDYSHKKIKKQKIIRLIDRMDRSHPIKIE